MSRTTRSYDAAGNLVSRTVTTRGGCGCGGLFTLLLVIFVIAAPAYYAGRGNWPLGWVGAVLAYIVEAAIVLAALSQWQQRRAKTTATAAAPSPPSVPLAPVTPPATRPVRIRSRDELAEELERLAELHRSGTLNDEEFAAAKSKLLGTHSGD